jgi:hypothetical protein
MSIASVKFVHDVVLKGEDSVQVLRECTPRSLVFKRFFSDLVTDGSKHYLWLSTVLPMSEYCVSLEQVHGDLHCSATVPAEPL